MPYHPEPDELSVTLAAYGEALDPDALTAAAGIRPTRAWRIGEFRKRSRPAKIGGWLFEARATPPDLARLVAEIHGAIELHRWREATADLTVQLRVASHSDQGSIELVWPRHTREQAAELAGSLVLDPYFYGPKGTPGPSRPLPAELGSFRSRLEEPFGSGVVLGVSDGDLVIECDLADPESRLHLPISTHLLPEGHEGAWRIVLLSPGVEQDDDEESG